MRRIRWFMGCALVLATWATLSAQDSLSTQVLQLLIRDNTWTGKQTFQNLEIAAGVPSITTRKLYTPNGTDLYWDGSLVAGSGSGTAPHNLLGTLHSDTNPDAATRGSIIAGIMVLGVPTWTRLQLGASGTVLRSDGTDIAWSTVGSGLTALNATELTSGTVPLARLSGITNTEISAGAAIAWTKISTTGSSLANLTTRSASDLSSGTLPDGRFPATLPAASGVNLTALNATNLGSGTLPDARFPATLPATSGVNLTALNATQLTSGTVPLARLVNISNTEIAAGAAIAWTKLSKTGSSLADLTTRSAADLSSGTLPDARLSGNVSLLGQTIDGVDIANGTITFSNWSLNGCTNGQVPASNGSSWVCTTLSLGTGTVTSVALSLPSIFSVSGSPVTTTGTLTGALATQVMNRIFAGPTSGADAAPTFRAMVNADLPASGAVAGSYSLVTINDRGVVTTGATATLANWTGTVTLARGGTGLTSAADDTTLVSTGAAYAAAVLCNSGATGALQYTTATNLFSCLANVATTDGVQTFTNKTVNVESTGNIITTVHKLVWRAAKCQNVTATTDWSLPTADPAAAACQTGANTQFGTLDYADGAAVLSAQQITELPTDWTGTVSASIVWFTSAIAGNVKWQLATACATTGESTNPAWNAADTVVQTAQGTTNLLNEAIITTVTTTGCSVGETLFIKFYRDPTDGADTLAATARLVNLELTFRRAQ